ncbi:hypothetical protein BDY19DRAFT_895433 [Irpex rosettiformis]|uniref:Uncharacterized protein n=1 Tax=Irpex rosettiformis TaxID=378272 RepID=A0ACB8TVU0_9APHY|nr:hypothetical protein BDY19DRAFT_895433 [Irpex rosettiformis]
MPSLKPYGGAVRKLVLAFDVGTTFSGVSYAILDPGETPKIQTITRYPGQSNGDLKIPTVLSYSADGQVQSVGAEVRNSAKKVVGEDKESPLLVEWFKLCLCPNALKNDLEPEFLPTFPDGKTAEDAFADFLRYLFACTRTYIIETHPGGEIFWNSVENHTEIILSHPNGWEGLQQSKMRDGAVSAGLIPDTLAGHQRIHFISEGEASLHYCLNQGLAMDSIEAGQSVMIIDAGGGTVDLSTYRFTSSAPVVVEETAPASCIMQGSTRVNMRARKFLEDKLKGSKYCDAGEINDMMEGFEKSVKPIFKDASKPLYIKFGGRRDNDAKLGIRSGQLTLEGRDLAGFFERSIDAIVDAAKEQAAASTAPVRLAWLVGGYAASPWLFEQLKERLGGLEIQLSRPDSQTNKAVPDGALYFYLGNIVTSRVAQLTYGVPCLYSFCPFDEEHLARFPRVVMKPSGEVGIPGGFGAILTRVIDHGTRTYEEQELSISLKKLSDSPIKRVTTQILCYRGSCDNPRWLDEGPEYFSPLCSVYADVPFDKSQKKTGTVAEAVFYEKIFKVILLCGSTELKAQISWEEDVSIVCFPILCLSSNLLTTD